MTGAPGTRSAATRYRARHARRRIALISRVNRHGNACLALVGRRARAQGGKQQRGWVASLGQAGRSLPPGRARGRVSRSRRSADAAEGAARRPHVRVRSSVVLELCPHPYLRSRSGKFVSGVPASGVCPEFRRSSQSSPTRQLTKPIPMRSRPSVLPGGMRAHLGASAPPCPEFDMPTSPQTPTSRMGMGFPDLESMSGVRESSGKFALEGLLDP